MAVGYLDLQLGLSKGNFKYLSIRYNSRPP